MNSGNIEDYSSWEDKYHHIRCDRDELAKRCNTLDHELRQVRTKFALLKAHGRQANTKGSGVSENYRTSKEDGEFIKDLQERNSTLLHDHKALQTKHISAVRIIKKNKEEIQSLKRRCNSGILTKKNFNGGCWRGVNDSYSEDMSSVVGQLQQRLLDGEKEVRALHEENERLRVEKTSQPISLKGPLAVNNQIPENRKADNEVYRLQQELSDAAAKLHLLQNRYDDLDSKCIAQSHLQKQSLSKLNECNDVIKKLQHELHTLHIAKATLDYEAHEAAGDKEQIQELTRQNEFLETQLTNLCELPFVCEDRSGEMALQKAKDLETKLQHANMEGERLTTELENLKKENTILAQHGYSLQSDHNVESERLAIEIERLKKAKEEVELDGKFLQRKCDDMCADIKHLASDHSALKKVCAALDGIDNEEFCRALEIVKRLKRTTNDAFCQCSEVESNEQTVSTLSRQLQRVQDDFQGMTVDLDRAERMLQIQVELNNDLKEKMNGACCAKDRTTELLQKSIDNIQLLAFQRLERIRILEDRIKLSSATCLQRDRNVTQHHDGSDDEVSDQNELACGSDKLGPDENILNVDIASVDLTQSSLSEDDRIIVVLDLFCYESQASPVVFGPHPNINFRATYKFQVESEFLHLLSTRPIMIEIHRLESSDSNLLASTSVPLNDLLGPNSQIHFPQLKLSTLGRENVFGFMDIKFQLVQSVASITNLLLEQCYVSRADKQECHNEVDRNVNDYGVLSLLAQPHKEATDMTVTIKEFVRPPSQLDSEQEFFVHYQLLGFPDVYTNFVMAAKGRTTRFGHFNSFQAVRSDALLHVLHDYTAQFSMFAGETNSGETPHLVGVAHLPLNDLVHGSSIESAVNLISPLGDIVGAISIGIQWNMGLQQTNVNVMLPQAGDSDVAAHFLSSDKKLIKYIDFLRIVDPPFPIFKTIRAMRDRIINRQGYFDETVLDSLTKVIGLGKERSSIAIDAFTNGMSVLGVDNQKDELADVMRYIDIAQFKSVDIEKLRLFLFNSTVSQLRQAFHSLRNTEISGREPFQKADIEHTGWMDVATFEQCMNSVGIPFRCTVIEM